MKKFKIIALLGLCLMGISFTRMHLFDPPAYFPEPVYDFDTNPLTAQKVALGRALFYDNLLSADNSLSCASCHSPYNSFAHTDHDLSHGIHDSIGRRNAPPLFNLAWHESFMWDGAIHHLDMQALGPITDAAEMGSDINQVVQKIQQHPRYPSLFYAAFGDSTITGEVVLKALSQFQLTLVSADSKYDKVKQGKAAFTEQEQKGYAVFKQHCASCHAEPLFTNGAFASNGLPVDTTLNDFGRYEMSHNPSDSLLFKVPSLRNLSYTFPYMHDGRFEKLSQVVNHYVSGVSEHANLADELRGGLPLNAYDKVDLIAFLHTLNDTAFVFDRKHGFPANGLP